VPTSVVNAQAGGGVIDVEEMRRRFGGDDDLVREIAREFVVGLAPMRAALTAASVKNDLVEMGRVAHRLRGALLEVAAPSAAQLARKIEEAPGSSGESLAALLPLLEEISTALAELGATQ
jgi:HPt (histidine-containing phosphotransfer) domain-containing protein